MIASCAQIVSPSGIVARLGVKVGAGGAAAGAGSSLFNYYHLWSAVIHTRGTSPRIGCGGLGFGCAGVVPRRACTPFALVQSQSSVLASRLTAEVRVARLARMAAQVKIDRRMIFW